MMNLNYSNKFNYSLNWEEMERIIENEFFIEKLSKVMEK